jgi:glycosyltransferase involved in cell wall biosynthesis
MAKPVIASELGGPAELVKDGATGLLVPPRDPAALAEGVLALIREPARARAMGEAGYAHAREHFDARTQVARTVAVYQELVPG